MDRGSDDSNIRTLRILAEVLSLMAIMLPVIGLGSRLISFSISLPNGPSFLTAWSASLSQLATTGFFAAFGPSIGFVVFLFLFKNHELPQKIRNANLLTRIKKVEAYLKSPDVKIDEASKKIDEIKSELELSKPSRLNRALSRKWSLWVMRLLFYPVIIFILSFLPFFPLPIIYFIGSNAAIWLVRRYDYKEVRLPIANLLPAVLVLTLTSMSTGISGSISGVNVANYRFENNALKNGHYIELAESSDSVYLFSCDGKKEVTRIVSSRVELVDYSIPQSFINPSLWMILHDTKMHIGIPDHC